MFVYALARNSPGKILIIIYYYELLVLMYVELISLSVICGDNYCIQTGQESTTFKMLFSKVR